MARIAFLRIMIFWIFLLGTLRDAISRVVFSELFESLDLFVSGCMQILNVILFGSMCIYVGYVLYSLHVCVCVGA